MESYREEYERKYGGMWDAIEPVSDELQNILETLCQRNSSLKMNGIAFRNDVTLEADSPYSFCMFEDISMLKLYFEHGNWSIRQGVVYRDLFFCNQVNGGDEWWVCKLDHDSNTYVPFESVSMDPVIKNGNFESLMDGLLSTIVHADEKATKVEAETKMNNDMGSSIEPIFSRNEAALIVELFEDLLEKFNIKIPSPEDNERAEDNGALLYGSVYSDLLDEVEESIINVVERARKQEIPLVKHEFSGDV